MEQLFLIVKEGTGQVIQGQSWREGEFFANLSKKQTFSSYCQKKFAMSFTYEDFPTEQKTKSKTGDSNKEDWQKKPGKINWKWRAEGRERGKTYKYPQVVKF